METELIEILSGIGNALDFIAFAIALVALGVWVK